MNQINPVTGYRLTLLGDDDAPGSDLAGWLQLLNGADDAGYVYLSDTPVPARLGGVGRLPAPYVVLSRPPAELPVLLAFLGDGRPKTVRLFKTDGQPGSAFLEHDGDGPDPDERAFQAAAAKAGT